MFAETCSEMPGKFWRDWYLGPYLLRLNKTSAPDYAACCAACQQIPTCTRFTFWPTSSLTCRLFDTAPVEVSLASQATSALMVSAPSPPPVASPPPPGGFLLYTKIVWHCRLPQKTMQ